MQINVLDYGFINLIESMGNDLTVVNSARVSFNKRHDSMMVGDDKLISFLMKHKHGTVFEHTYFTFHVKCPLFVAREWQRHRIGSFNEMSGRYTEMEEEFYIPEDSRIQTQVGKPGAYKYELLEPPIKRRLFIEHLRNINRMAWIEYQSAINQGISKELARLCLPLNLYTQYYWTVNARSLMNFISLRSAENAMWEIRQYSQALETLLNDKMPITYKAFIDNGRVAP